jgi:uncharacterized protein YbjT (DUF2867 family)
MIGVLGGTGQVGAPMMAALAEAGAPVRALAHSDRSAEQLAGYGADVVRGDVRDVADLQRFFDGVSSLFLLTTATPDQTEVQNRVVDAAAQAGVEAIVKLSVYTAADDSPCALSRWHAANDHYIAKSGVPFTILHPHTFMQSVALQFAPSVRSVGVMAGATRPDATVTMIDARDVAEVAAAVLLAGQHHGETLLITGPEALSYADCAAIIQKVTGTTVSYVHVPGEQVREELHAAGLPHWLADALLALQQMYDGGDLNPFSDAVPRLTGKPGRTFTQFVEENAGLFNPGLQRQTEDA